MNLRVLSEKDLKLVWSFFNELKSAQVDISFTENNTMEELKSWIINPLMVTVIATENGDLLAVARGIIGAGDKSHSAFLTAAVKSDSRSKGIAQELTDYLNRELYRHGVKIVRAYVYSDNKPSVRTLEKQNFVFSGKVLMHHLDAKTNTYVDDLIYHKLLERDYYED